MTKKTKGVLIFLVSILMISLDFRAFKDITDFAVGRYTGDNLIKEKYENEEYNFIVENDHSLNFLRGNSLVKLGDIQLKEEKKDEAIKNYESALDFYKLAIEQKEDVNIKKNYEIVLNKISELKAKEQQNQENKENQDEQQKNENQEKNSKDQNSSQDKKDSSESQEQQNQEQNQQNEENKEKQKNQNSQENSEDQKKSESEKNQQNEQEKNLNQESGDLENSTVNIEEKKAVEAEEGRKQQEIQYILQKLEGNEKQAFKNNERFINQNSQENSKKW